MLSAGKLECSMSVISCIFVRGTAPWGRERALFAAEQAWICSQAVLGWQKGGIFGGRGCCDE